ncbi:MAG: inositol monophosphatase [Alphaproteobacteria bacterium]|nr:inositol monophosphatase [Alphaproteobacteria bacterium]
MDHKELRDALALALSTAKAAGAALRAHRGEWSGVEAEAGREVKIDADKRAEALIVAALRRETSWPILSEEAGWVDGGEAPLIWAVDPLDGSVNYALGYPHCAVSIALVQDRTPILGVVDCFALDETFAGAAGVGATLNDAPIRVSAVADPKRGVVQTGIPARMATDPARQAALMRTLMTWRKVRMIGSAASALASVACGRADAYSESGSMLWDVAGGLALVRAAGGAVRISEGALDAPLDVWASNGQPGLGAQN